MTQKFNIFFFCIRSRFQRNSNDDVELDTTRRPKISVRVQSNGDGISFYTRLNYATKQPRSLGVIRRPEMHDRLVPF